MSQPATEAEIGARKCAGVILAGGRGSRMGALTELQPKCLTVLAGRTLLSWQVEALRGAGIQQVTVIGGYRSEMLEGEFETRRNPRWGETNMVRTLLEADDVLSDGPTIVSYSDIVYRSSHVRALRAVSGLAITYDLQWRCLWEERFSDPLADAETFKVEQGKLVEIGRRPGSIDEVQGQYMGLLHFTPAAWKEVRTMLRRYSRAQLDTLDMTTLLRGYLAEGGSISAVPIGAGWCEVDSDADLAYYERSLARSTPESPWHHDWREGGSR